MGIYDTLVDGYVTRIFPNSPVGTLVQGLEYIEENSDDLMHGILDTYPLDGDSLQEEVNRRVTDRLYQGSGVDPIDTSKYSFLVVPDLVISSLRRYTRWLVPKTLEAAVTKDHPEIEAQVLVEMGINEYLLPQKGTDSE